VTASDAAPALDPTAYADRRAIVTGGLGFIGSHLAERLAHLGARVLVIDAEIDGLGANRFNIEGFASRVEVAPIDVRDAASLGPLLDGADVVFDLAGQVSHVDSMDDPLADLELNVRAPLTLLEAIRRRSPHARVVFTSTRQVYGRTERRPVDEHHPVRPTDVNGVNKHAAEGYHRMYHRVHGTDSVVLRLTNTYGPRQLLRHGRQGFIPFFIRAALEGRAIPLFGGGAQVRDANHVLDVVDALVLAGHPDAVVGGETFNLGGAEAFTLRHFAEQLIDIAGSGRIEEVPWPSDRAAIDIGDFAADHGAITSALGWEPEIGLRTGLEETVKFVVEHGHHYW
jgi:UDP-glucose 4-epimerase